MEESINRKLKITLLHGDSPKSSPKRRDLTAVIPSSLSVSAPSHHFSSRTNKSRASKIRSPKLTVDGDIFAAALSYSPEGHEHKKEPSSLLVKANTSEKGSPVPPTLTSRRKVDESPPPSLERSKLEGKGASVVKSESDDRDGDVDDDFDKDADEGQEPADSAANNKVTDLYSTYEPNLHDHTALHLQQLLNHHLVKDRPPFYDAISNLLEYKAQEESVPVKQITASLSEVVHYLSPYLTAQEQHSCENYIKMVIIRDQYQQFQVEEEEHQMSELQKGALRSLFNFFDKDKSGTVNLREIMEVVKQTNLNSRNKKNDFDLLDSGSLPAHRRRVRTPERNKNGAAILFFFL